MAIISRDHKYLFICAPGTGCSAASKALLDHNAGQWLPSEDILDSKKRLSVGYKHSTIKELLSHELLSQEELDSLYTFVTVRNPFDTWVSDWFRYKRWVKFVDDPTSWIYRNERAKERCRLANEKELGPYIKYLLEDQRDRPQLLNAKYIARVPNIIRHETLQENLDETMKKLGFPEGAPMERINVSLNRDPDYRTYYDEETRDIIYDVFRPTFDRFGYTF